MKTNSLEVYLGDSNKDYLDKLTFAALFRSRSLGFNCAADLFCEAYRNYDHRYTNEFLTLLHTGHVCKYIIDRHDIDFKEDLIYLLRHPALFDINLDEKQKPIRRKIMYFYGLEENNYKQEAYDYLDNMRPALRAAQVDRILEQYLILTENEYYIEQAAARLLQNLIEDATFDEEGKLEGYAKEVVDTIWMAGKKSRNT